MNELSLFNTLFDDGFGIFPSVRMPKARAVPSVDVQETKDAYTLSMDLPGRTEDDVELSLKDKVLTIASRTEQENEEKKEQKDGATYLIRERRTASFARSFTLPDDVDENAIGATFKNGVLTVALPRTKPVNETKKIAISAA